MMKQMEVLDGFEKGVKDVDGGRNLGVSKDGGTIECERCTEVTIVTKAELDY